MILNYVPLVKPTAKRRVFIESARMGDDRKD